jgi:hypothetical protein
MGLSHPGTVVKGAGDLRGDVGVELVGAEDEHDLVTLDSGSVGDRPLDDRALLHGHAELGDDHVGRHGGRLPTSDQRAPGDNASRAGDVGLLEHWAERHRAERRPQAGDRSIEIVEPVLGDSARNSAPMPPKRTDSCTTSARCVGHGFEHRRQIEGLQGPRVDHLDGDPRHREASRPRVPRSPCDRAPRSSRRYRDARRPRPRAAPHTARRGRPRSPSRNLFRMKITGSSSRTDAMSSPWRRTHWTA